MRKSFKKHTGSKTCIKKQKICIIDAQIQALTQNCNICSKRFQTESKLKRHAHICHVMHQKFLCILFGFRSKRNGNLDIMFKEHTMKDF